MIFRIKFLILFLVFSQHLFAAVEELNKWDIVNCNDTLDRDELNYQKQRTFVTNAALKRVLNCSDNNIKLPRIGICCSGGGVRAQVATLGFLAGADYTGLLDTVSHIATLSGSTWAIIPWILHKMSPIDYSSLVRQQLKVDFWDVKQLNSELTKIMLENMRFNVIDVASTAYKYKLKFTELWGHLIARRLLYDLTDFQHKQPTFNDIRKILAKQNNYPFPIFTTLISETSPEYEGFEVTPYSSYSNALGASIPTKYLGSLFQNGVCKNVSAEKPLSFYMGMFGSAFNISAPDTIIHVLSDLCDIIDAEDTFIGHIQSRLTTFFKKFDAYKLRNFDIKMPNYTYKIASETSNKMYNLKSFHLLDYGIYFNLPIFPFLRDGRKPDILMICDASSDAPDCDFTQLKYAKKFVAKFNFKFPSLQKFKDLDKNLKIFYENDPDIPMIIYLANMTNIRTIDMNYETDEEFNSVYQPMVNTITNLGHQAAIVEAIKFKTAQINKQPIQNKFEALPNGKYVQHTCSLL